MECRKPWQATTKKEQNKHTHKTKAKQNKRTNKQTKKAIERMVLKIYFLAGRSQERSKVAPVLRMSSSAALDRSLYVSCGFFEMNKVYYCFNLKDGTPLRSKLPHRSFVTFCFSYCSVMFIDASSLWRTWGLMLAGCDRTRLDLPIYSAKNSKDGYLSTFWE